MSKEIDIERVESSVFHVPKTKTLELMPALEQYTPLETKGMRWTAELQEKLKT